MRSPPDVDAAVDRMRTWGECCSWSGWDPYDALNSPFAGVLSLGTPLGRRLLTQLVKTSPVNLRPALRIAPERDAKAISLVLSGYARLAGARGDAIAEHAARRLAAWLRDAAIATRRGTGWGYHFDVQTRFFRYRRGEPNLVATAFAAQALLDAREILDETSADDLLRQTVCFLAGDLLVDGPRTYFRYVDEESELIHNANLLACAVLARAASALGDSSISEPVARAAQTTLDAQADDGSWPYAEGSHGAWVDNFHTGYVLESLAACEPLLPAIGPQLDAGIAFWERALFTSDGTPRANPHATFPVDAHSYAQGVETWLAVAHRRADARENAERLAALLIERMLEEDGHVCFERRKLWMNRTAFVRWTTAPSFRALARLLLARARTEAAPYARVG